MPLLDSAPVAAGPGRAVDRARGRVPRRRRARRSVGGVEQVALRLVEQGQDQPVLGVVLDVRGAGRVATRAAAGPTRRSSCAGGGPGR